MEFSGDRTVRFKVGAQRSESSGFGEERCHCYDIFLDTKGESLETKESFLSLLYFC